jgi:O-6-methylguanine DNA methyltransferase
MNITYLNSPIGLIKLASELSASCESSFSVQREMITEVSFVNEECQSSNSTELLEDAKNQLEEYFKGVRKTFKLPLKLNGTEFQVKVWEELLNIPYGKTATYKEVAVNMGNENAQRAVGGANNKNKIVIIVPCHRVIGASNKLTGYGGGLDKKEWLLKLEADRSNNC